MLCVNTAPSKESPQSTFIQCREYTSKYREWECSGNIENVGGPLSDGIHGPESRLAEHREPVLVRPLHSDIYVHRVGLQEGGGGADRKGRAGWSLRSKAFD